MNWSDVGAIVGRAAPVVGTLLGGPAGAAVGALVASALGTSNDPDAVNAALAADPSALARVQELQINAKVQLQQLAVTAENNRLQAEAIQYAAEASDRDSARTLAASQPRDLIRPAITIMLIVGAFTILAAVFGGYAENVLKDPTASGIAGIVIGFWFNELKQTLGFYFGMTKESQTQNAIVTSFAVEPGTVSKPKKD